MIFLNAEHFLLFQPFPIIYSSYLAFGKSLENSSVKLHLTECALFRTATIVTLHVCQNKFNINLKLQGYLCIISLFITKAI